jgi:hypothetical protein
MKNKIIVFMIFFVIASVGIAAAQTAQEITYSVDGYLQNRYPMSSYGDYVTTGIGAGTQLNVDIAGLGAVLPYMGVDYSYGISEVDYVDRIQDLTVTLGAGFRVGLSEAISVVPELGYGMLLHMVAGEIEGESNKVYADQVFRSSVKGLYALSETVELYLAPTYTLFLEEQDAGMELGYQLGARINL